MVGSNQAPGPSEARLSVAWLREQLAAHGPHTAPPYPDVDVSLESLSIPQRTVSTRRLRCATLRRALAVLVQNNHLGSRVCAATEPSKQAQSRATATRPPPQPSRPEDRG